MRNNINEYISSKDKQKFKCNKSYFGSSFNQNCDTSKVCKYQQRGRSISKDLKNKTKYSKHIRRQSHDAYDCSTIKNLKIPKLFDASLCNQLKHNGLKNGIDLTMKSKNNGKESITLSSGHQTVEIPPFDDVGSDTIAAGQDVSWLLKELEKMKETINFMK